MKYFVQSFLVVILSLFGINNSYAQIHEWEWADAAIGNYLGESNNTIADKEGNTYITGYFIGSPIFGSDTLKGSNLNRDMFIVKYDRSGNALWARSAGGDRDDAGSGITIDSKGDIYIIGYFESDAISFGENTLKNMNTGYADVFISKYESSGDLIWAKSVGGSARDEATTITVDHNDNFYIAGLFFSSTLNLGIDTLSNKGDADMFFIKFDKNGNVIWGKSTGGNRSDYVNDIKIDKYGNLYTAGYFYSPILDLGTDTLINAGSSDNFTAKFDENGELLWAKAVGNENENILTGCAVDNNGIYITGYFYGSSITFGTITLNNIGSANFFLVKYSEDGTVVWAKSAGGSKYDLSNSVTTDFNGYIYIAGTFNSSIIDLGSSKLVNTSESNDMFIIKYDSKGNILWSNSNGGDRWDVVKSVTTDSKNNIYLTGYFDSPIISFGSIVFNNEDRYKQIFIAKVNSKATSITKELHHQITSILSLFPNPTKSTFHISGIEPGNWNISIYSLTGEKIYESLLKDSQTIDLSGRAKGIYVYQLQKDGEILKTGKIALE